MKKLIVTTIVAATALTSALAQGTITFANRLPSAYTAHVFGPEVGNPTLSIKGQTSTDSPAGTTIYTGVALSGANYLAQLLSAPGNDQPLSSLVSASSAPATFRTGTGAGFNAQIVATLSNVAGDAPAATLAMVAWDNSSGLYGTWALASVAWQNGLIAAGISPTFNVAAIGGTFNSPPAIAGIQSFNIYSTAAVVPEPSTFALAGLGLAGLMIFRRRK